MSTYDKLVGATAQGELPPAVLDGIDTHVAKYTPTASPTAHDYWVSPTGDDAQDGTQARPFRTIEKAQSMVPDLVRADHVYTITLGPGTWTEEINLSHRVVYGQVIFQGGTEERELHKVNRVRCDAVLGYITIRNITTTRKNAQGASFWFERCAPMVEVINCKAESDSAVEKGVQGAIGLLADHGSNVMVRESDFGGKRYGMRSNYLSRIFSYENTGSDSSFGLGARWGGILSTYGTRPTGDTPLTHSSGGILAHNHGAKLGVEGGFGLVQEDAHGDRGPSRRRYLIRSVVTGISTDIGPNQRFRVRIRARSYGYAVIRASYSGQVNSSAGQGIEKVFGILLRAGTSTSEHDATVFDHSMGAQNMRLQHTGANGEIDLIVQPQAALSGRWGIDLDMSLMTQQEAPEVVSVDLVSA